MKMMFARGEGVPVDAAALDAAVDEAVQEMVDRQAAAGIDIIGDGEMSKPSYATYIQDRLTGFGGEGASYAFQDLDDFPGTKARVFGDTGRARRARWRATRRSRSRTWMPRASTPSGWSPGRGAAGPSCPPPRPA
ncbi:MAG: hypothetical protein WDN24_16645 [Sphingomonas sp.]